jgi:hypothetical protein
MNPVTTSYPTTPPDADTLAMLASLRAAVTEALERKRRLGQYSVQWSPEGPRLHGPDAPPPPSAGTQD